MANFKLLKDKTEVIRVPKNIRDKLKNLTFDLSVIERKKVTTPEILERTFNNMDVIERLKLGSLERKQKK